MNTGIHMTPALRDELARRKQTMRELWRGTPMDTIPVIIRVRPPARYSVRAAFQDGGKQLEEELRAVAATLENIRYTDAIPAMRPDVGCSCIASAFGCEYYWGENENQTPGIKTPILHDIEDAGALSIPAVEGGWLGEGLRRIAMFAEAGGGDIPVSLLDSAGGVNVAADLTGLTELLAGMPAEPECVHTLLGTIQTFYLRVLAESVKAAGGEENITTTDFLDLWFPEGCKGHVSDDICAMYGPDTYDEFSGPYHRPVFEKYGGGGLHNCGPNPCAARYVSQPLSPRCIDLSYTYSKNDLPKLGEALGGRAFVYLTWDGTGDPVEWFRAVTRAGGDRLCILPAFHLSTEDDIPGIYRGLSAVAREYAARLNWQEALKPLPAGGL